MKLYNPNIDLINDNVHTKFGKKLSVLILKILSGNQILTLIKGHNSVANEQKSVLYNPNLDVININVYTKLS